MKNINLKEHIKMYYKRRFYIFKAGQTEIIIN